MKDLRERFETPKHAERHYFPVLVAGDHNSVSSPPDPETVTPSQVMELFQRLSEEAQLEVLNKLYSSTALASGSVVVPDGFLKLSIKAMSHLKRCGRTNIVYNLVRRLGEMRADKSDSLLPAKRMPMGLLEYCTSFFCSNGPQQVRIHTVV